MFFPIDDYTVGTHTVSETELFLRADTSGGAVILNLPAGVESAHYIIKKLTSDTNPLTINPPAGKTIDGLTTIDILGNKQCLWIVRQSDGNYDIIAGGGGGTSTGRDVDYVELVSDAGLSTSDSPISGMSIALELLTSGKVILSTTGQMSYGSGAFYSSELTIRVVGSGTTDYVVSTNVEQQGAGSDHIEKITHAGRKGIFLNAGSYTISLRGSASPAGGSLLAGALLGIDIPVLTGGGSIVGSAPTGAAGGIDISGTYPDDVLVVGLQGDLLPTSIPNKFLHRKADDSGWDAFAASEIPLDTFGVPTDITNLNASNTHHGLLIKLTDVTNQFLRADGTWAIPASSGSGGSGFDTMVQKDFFSDLGYVPSTTLFEASKVFPARDFNITNGNTHLYKEGSLLITPAGGSASLIGWDLGTDYSKVLIIVAVRSNQFGIGPFACHTLPTTEVSSDDYFMSLNAFGTRIELDKAGGSFTAVQQQAGWGFAAAVTNPTALAALYLDGSGHIQRGWVKNGNECWISVIDSTDTTNTQFRYVGVRAGPQGSGNLFWVACPIGVYYGN